MKLVTYNMQNNSKSTDNWNVLFDDFDPDIVLAQESLPPEQYQRPLLEDGWSQNVAWMPVWPKWGSAVYIKSHKPEALELPEFQGWVVGVELDAPVLTSTGNKVRLFSLHAPTCDESYPSIVNKILDMLEDYRDGCDVVIGGDFNLTVSKRHESEERKNKRINLEVQDRLHDFGLINCWQTANPDVPVAQTLRWDRDPKPNFHCDGIFVPESWASRLVSCDVLSGEKWVELSDHNLVVAEFS